MFRWTSFFLIGTVMIFTLSFSTAQSANLSTEARHIIKHMAIVRQATNEMNALFDSELTEEAVKTKRAAISKKYNLPASVYYIRSTYFYTRSPTINNYITYYLIYDSSYAIVLQSLNQDKRKMIAPYQQSFLDIEFQFVKLFK